MSRKIFFAVQGGDFWAWFQTECMLFRWLKPKGKEEDKITSSKLVGGAGDLTGLGGGVGVDKGACVLDKVVDEDGPRPVLIVIAHPLVHRQRKVEK